MDLNITMFMSINQKNVYDYYKINGMSINKSHSLFGELLWKNNK